MQTLKSILERVNPCEPADEHINSSEIKSIISKFQKVFNTLGVDFTFSRHGGLGDRLNDPRNKPPISKCEFDAVMTSFVRKMGSQLFNDVKDIQNNNVKPRGKRINSIRKNNFEYGIKSKSTGIAIILALQPNPDKSSKFRVRVNIITIIRKPSFTVNQGETVIVEGDEYNLNWIEVD